MTQFPPPSHASSRRRRRSNDSDRSSRPCRDQTAPICECCTIFTSATERSSAVKKDASTSTEAPGHDNTANHNGMEEEDMKELVIIGAGPHALSLVLRLLEPDADLLTDKQRHAISAYTSKMRPLVQVRQHLKRLSKGPTSVLLHRKNKGFHHDSSKEAPAVDLVRLRTSVLVLDQQQQQEDSGSNSSSTGWLQNWKNGFQAFQIPHLRSHIYAHCDPYDHRSLELYSDTIQDDYGLVTMPHLTQRNKSFKGPYQVPTNELFLEYHELLTKAYGIQDMVHSQVQVQSIRPCPPPPSQGGEEEGEPYFELQLLATTEEEKQQESSSASTTTGTPPTSTICVKTRRVVCAMGPQFQSDCIPDWEEDLRERLRLDTCQQQSGSTMISTRPYPSDAILHAHEIVPWLLQRQQQQQHEEECSTNTTETNTSLSENILVVGGGLTSAHVAMLLASSSQCNKSTKVTLLQRSKLLQRQFDLDNAWMGPQRGKCLDKFWKQESSNQRLAFLKQARKGGSVPPEMVQALQDKSSISILEESSIEQVDWCPTDGQFHVSFQTNHPYEGGSSVCAAHDDEPPLSGSFHRIILATGAQNILDKYPALMALRQELPIAVAGGLPVLNDHDLSWGTAKENDKDNDTRAWQQALRQRCFVLGSLAAHALGPDALNLLGARHGAVKVARALRKDMNKK